MHRCHTQRCPLYTGSSSEKNKNNMKWEEGHNMYIIYRRQGIHISILQQNLDTKRERQAHSCNLNFVSFCSFEWVLKSERIFF